MASTEPVTGDLSVIRRRRREIAGKRWWTGGDINDTPSLAWNYSGGDSDGGTVVMVTARKLAASLWRQLTGGGGSVSRLRDRLGFEFCSMLSIPKFAAEGATKWDDYFRSSASFTHEAGLFKSQTRGSEYEANGRWSKMKMEKRCCEFKKLKNNGVQRESNGSRNKDTVNSEILLDNTEGMFIQNLEREKKSREDLEKKCENLAKEIVGSKAQIGALMNQQKRIQMEVEEERKMSQLAEVWREERLQMKIADASLILEDRYAEISNLIADLQALLRRLNLIENEDDMMCKAKALMQAVDSVSIQHAQNSSKSSNQIAVKKDCHEFTEANRIGDHHRSHKSEASEITIASLNQPKKKDPSGSKIQKACSRSKDTCKRIMFHESSDRSVQRNPHVVRAMKGHIEWPPRGLSMGNSATNRPKATLERQKTLLRNVLKQRNIG